jgi:cysteine-rich repeat protein
MKKERVVMSTLVLVVVIIFISLSFVSAVDNTGCIAEGGTKGVYMFDASADDYKCFECGDTTDHVCPLWYGADCFGDEVSLDPDCNIGPAVCGNGIQEEGEACDDSNTDDGDGCSSTCELEISQWCIDEGITNCGDYDEAHCIANDICNKAGSNYWEEYTNGGDNCEIELNPECRWSDNEEGFCYTANVPTEEMDGCSDIGDEIKDLISNPCGYKSTMEGDCKAGASSVKVSYSPLLTNEAVCDTAKPAKTFPCPASIELPFFSIFNLIITALIIAGIYALSGMFKRRKE